MSDATSSRIASRMEGTNLLNAISLLLHTLSGATFVHYGDEIGMKDTWYNGSLGEVGSITVISRCFDLVIAMFGLKLCFYWLSTFSEAEQVH